MPTPAPDEHGALARRRVDGCACLSDVAQTLLARVDGRAEARVGRHRTPQEEQQLGEKARAMRAEGRSRREIKAELHVGEDLLGRLLAGTAVPTSLTRARAKDGLRDRAVELRLGGRTYDEIAHELGVSKASCSLWLRDLPRPEDDPGHRAAAEARRIAAARARAARDTARRDVEGDAVAGAAAAWIGPVDERDLRIAFAVSYWCEGAKRKPWSRGERISWMNSDPVLVRLFLEGLRLFGVGDERIACQLQLHESADEAAATAFWRRETGLPASCFRPTVLKRHNPRTVRKNVGGEYHGCLGVRVRRSRDLYLVVRGLVEGLAAAPRTPSVAPWAWPDITSAGVRSGIV